MKAIIVGYGSISTALLPILTKELGQVFSKIIIIDPKNPSAPGCISGLTFVQSAVTKDNYKELLSTVDSETFVINLSVDVSSIDLVAYCQERGALYIDTCIEPWGGHYVDPSIEASSRTNYALREAMLALRKQFPTGPTAVIAHGANPGIVSHFIKKALHNLKSTLIPDDDEAPRTRQDWAALASKLSIRTIHIAEHDTQLPLEPKRPNEFVNTWSVDGFISEGCQPAELGWGTHEDGLPLDAQEHHNGSRCAIYLNKPGASVRVKTWTPAQGPCLGFLITHNESISIADYLTHIENGEVVYRPTVHYAYHPCGDAILSLHEFNGRSWQPQESKRVLSGTEIASGADFLGVLLMGHANNAYWLGSTLSNHEAKKIDGLCSATSLQVVAGVVSGIKWALANPQQGIVEADEIDFEAILDYARPYLGEVVGVYTDWSPIKDDQGLFPRKSNDAWQFENFLA